MQKTENSRLQTTLQFASVTPSLLPNPTYGFRGGENDRLSSTSRIHWRHPSWRTEPPTAACTSRVSSLPSLPPSLSNRQHRGSRGAALYKAQIRAAIWSGRTKAALTTQDAGLFIFFYQSFARAHALNKTLFLTQCLGLTKLLRNFDLWAINRYTNSNR